MAENIEQVIFQKKEKIEQLKREIHKVIIGQHEMIDRLLIGLFTNGHILLEGVPGLAKTLTISTLAAALDLKFQRIQFTPDLLPSDLIGTLIYNQRDQVFEVRKGPIFTNIVLADEINRSPAKVQSALLEAMQEKQVTIANTTYKLPSPFLVLATQNPLEQEGTYPLPEAQTDRFMMKIFVNYPSKEEELAIMRLMAHPEVEIKVQPVFSVEQIKEIRKLIDKVNCNSRLENYIIEIVTATRFPAKSGLPKLASYIEYGASPRASIALNLASKAYALMQGRSYVLPQDIKDVAYDVLNHRILLTYEAEAEGIHTRWCIEQILNTLPI
ncbi:MAG: MoxR family ATPase [Bacteroidia bacterium]|nr:MoxR family ATPase [Bacteroidia bacterium]MDW8159413.1 MoxR family ATPase [Bacteroidia bacterium]